MGAEVGKEKDQKLAGKAHEKQLHMIVLVVLFYFVVSMGIVFLNKHLTNMPNAGVYSITYYQFVVTLVIASVLGHLGKSIPMFSSIAPFEFDLDIAQQVAPLACIQVAMIVLNNFCLANVEVSFYQVARSLTICFNIVFSKVLLGQDTSHKAIQACGVVIVGFILGAKGEMRFSWYGVIFGVSASCFVSLNSIYIKRTLKLLESNQWRLLYYNTTLSLFLLFPFVYLSGELDTLFEYEGSGSTFWQIMTLTGVFGFLINIASSLQIKYTSPLTHNISGTAKACLQTLLSILIFRNPVSMMNAVGILLTIAGSAWYSRIRFLEMEARRAEEESGKV